MDYQRLYEYRHRKVEQTSRVAVWEEISSFIWEQMGRPSVMLDPAAGLGEFINTVPAAERWAVDAFEYPEGTYGPGVRHLIADVLEAELPSSHFDGVFISNFLEHLASQSEIADCLERLADVMVPGGRIAVMGPNFRYTMRTYFDMADHTLALTHLAVAEHLYAAGFTPQRIEPRILPYSFTGRLPPDRRLVRWYLQMPLAWRLLGKQFLVIASR